MITPIGEFGDQFKTDGHRPPTGYIYGLCKDCRYTFAAGYDELSLIVICLVSNRKLGTELRVCSHYKPRPASPMEQLAAELEDVDDAD